MKRVRSLWAALSTLWRGKSPAVERGASAPRVELPAKGPSGKYDQDFFLARAAEGKDAWNEWRREAANKDMRVTFAGIDFSEAPRDSIDFSGFEFGDNANFSGCKWRGVEQRLGVFAAFEPGRACFDRAVFGQDTNFRGAVFGGRASFAFAYFSAFATFEGATFGENADFSFSRFDILTNFNSAQFSKSARFECATFGLVAHFNSTTFGNDASFGGAAFGRSASFHDAHFIGEIKFAGMSTIQWDKAIHPVPEKRHEDFWEADDSGPDRFLTISFARARFYGEANFAGRSFEETANFTNVRFYRPPDFRNATNVDRVDFTGAKIGFVPPGELHWTTDTQVPVRLRAFRKIAEETKNHDLERDLYIEERKAERGVIWRQRREDLKTAPIWKEPLIAARLLSHVLWIAVMFFYWALADYGRSFLRPAMWLGISVWLFHWGYATVLAPLMQQAGPSNAARYEQAIWMVARGNAVPFVGPLTIDPKIKEFLFRASECSGTCPPIPPESFQLLMIAQNVVSIALIFFFGLALRNYFKIK